MALHPAPCYNGYTEQRRKNRSSSAKTITCTPAAEGTALVVGGAAHLLEAGRTDVQLRYGIRI